METTIFKKVRNSINHWYLPVIVGVLFIITAILTFMKPVESYDTLAFIFSLTFLVSGIMEAFFAISNRKEVDNWGWSLVFGILNVIIGLMLLGNRLLTWETLALYVGFVFMFRSISAIGWAIDLKQYGVSDWGGLLATGILGLIVSFFLISNPLFAGLTVVIWTAFAFLVLGVFAIYFGFRLKKLHDLTK